ncbi:MAG: hypothetical protein HY560_00950 [Gemmatimonadetes bacterium]|nr:hypothetical protein [Gemmatimonadota bacterium]
MRMLLLIGAGTLAPLVMVTPAHGQEDEGSLSVSAFAGLQNQPGGFDVFRSVDYGSGKFVGGGLTLGLFRGVAIRGDFAYALSSGQESGAVSEAVDLNRSYYGASVEFRLLTSMGVAPYLLAGGGVVKLRRTAPSYNFNLSESGALLGGGIAYHFPASPVSVFLQVTEWIYSRTSAGGAQYDTAFGAGLTYKLPL